MDTPKQIELISSESILYYQKSNEFDFLFNTLYIFIFYIFVHHILHRIDLLEF